MGRSSDSWDSTLSRCPQCPWCARQRQAFPLAWALSRGSPGLESPLAQSPGFLASVLWHLQVLQDKLGKHRTGQGRRCTKIPSASPQGLIPGGWTSGLFPSQLLRDFGNSTKITGLKILKHSIQCCVLSNKIADPNVASHACESALAIYEVAPCGTSLVCWPNCSSRIRLWWCCLMSEANHHQKQQRHAAKGHDLETVTGQRQVLRSRSWGLTRQEFRFLLCSMQTDADCFCITWMLQCLSTLRRTLQERIFYHKANGTRAFLYSNGTSCRLWP